MNNRKIMHAALLGFALVAVACKSQFELKSVERTRIVVDCRYDAAPDAEAEAFLAPYKRQVDSIMSPVVGRVAHDMKATRPESDLSNLLPDILMWAAKDYGEHPVAAVYNVGGIRAALTKGEVTYGDVLDVAPFENKICFVTLSGEQLMELFAQIAHRGGEGVSHGVQLVITPDGQLLSATLNGKPIDPEASYRLTTIDYLAQGNDGLEAFTKGTDLNSPQEESNNARFIIMHYFRQMSAKGQEISSQTEGRITVAQQ